MRRVLLVVAVVVTLTTSLVACGDDGKPDKTIAILRAVAVAPETQKALLGVLADAGWKEGDNLTVLDPDVTEAHADPDDAAAAVRGWVKKGVDMIIALSTPAAMAAMKAAPKTPILTLANDPVGSGLLKDPDEPEGNLTGVAFRTPPDRTIDVATRIADDITTIGVLAPADDPAGEPVRKGLDEAARSLSVKVVDAAFHDSSDVGTAVDALASGGAQVVVLVNSAATVRVYDALGAALSAAKLPAVANIVSNPFALVILAPDQPAAYRQLGRQAVRLLNDTSVSKVPIEEPGEF
ncbi:MAG: putative tryptophan/tyrosine transport system substrate-binding protein, partial [Actinomycetota bacterium]